MQRLLTAAAMIVAVLSATLLATPRVFEVLFAAFSLVVVYELTCMLRSMGLEPYRWIVLPGTVAFIVALIHETVWTGAILALVFVAGSLCAIFSGKEPAESARRLMGTMVTVAYLGPLLAYLGRLQISPEVADVPGRHLLIFALLVTYLGDSFAYYGGSSFGRHKLAPRISPGKTWEGALFAVLGGTVAALAFRPWVLPDLALSHALILGVLLSVAGILGDLVESILKRASGVKDSGGWLPGHGGFLDRIDSLLFAAPVLYWYCRLVQL